MNSWIYNYISIIGLLLIIIFTSTHLNGGVNQKEYQELSLDDSVKIAITNNPAYQSSMYNIQAKKKLISEANANFYYPSIDVSAKYSYTKLDPEPTFPSYPEKYNTSLSINKVIYDFGRLSDSISIAERNYDLSRIDAIRQRNDLIKNVKTAYFTVLLNQRNLQVIQKNFDILKENAMYQKRNYDRGKTGKFDYLRIKIQYENEKVNLTRAKEQLIKSVNQLFNILGFQYITNLKELKTVFKGWYPYNPLINSQKIKEISLHDARYYGSLNRSEVQKIYIQKKLLALNQNIVNTKWKPVFSVFGTMSYDYTRRSSISFGSSGLVSNYGDWYGTATWMLGIQVQLSLSELLFPNSASKSKSKSLDYDIKSANASLKASQDQISREITEYYLALKEAEKNIYKRFQVMKLSVENFKIAARRYKTGGIDFINYRDVELQARQAQLSFYQELYNYNVAYVNLLHAIGLDLWLNQDINGFSFSATNNNNNSWDNNQ